MAFNEVPGSDMFETRSLPGEPAPQTGVSSAGELCGRVK
jgi:hypothetical protein